MIKSTLGYATSMRRTGGIRAAKVAFESNSGMGRFCGSCALEMLGDDVVLIPICDGITHPAVDCLHERSKE